MVKPNSLSNRKKSKSAPEGRGDRKAARASGKKPDAGRGAEIPPPPDTEKRILSAARKEFIAKGRDGARMQAVATSAGVNKALLHYYFRSKDKLYARVIEDTVATVWGAIARDFRRRDPAEGLEPLLRTVVETYVRVLAANPEFPLFMFREMASGAASLPEGVKGLLGDFRHVPETLVAALRAEIAAGRVKPIAPVHFFMNLMGMTVATFLMMPLIRKAGPAFGVDIRFDEAFIEERIRAISDTMLNGIRIPR